RGHVATLRPRKPAVSRRFITGRPDHPGSRNFRAAFFFAQPNTIMKHNPIPRFAAALLSAVLLPLAALAQAGTGAITGRVFNPATGEYIRNADVRIEGTQQVAHTEDGGYYQLHNAPAGSVKITATYTGHESVTAQVKVAPGSTVTQDFELAPAGSRRTAQEVVQLG